MSRLGRNRFAGFLILLCSVTAPIVAQYGARNGEWTVYGGDPGSTGYSPIDQINRDNVRNLQVAWTFKTDNFAPVAVPQNQSTPIMVKGILVTDNLSRRSQIRTTYLPWFISPGGGHN